MPPEGLAAPERAGALSLALDPAVATPGDRTSERILDAALALVAEAGLRGITMDAVAARAGAGRMTVYRRFGERARLVQALTVRETRHALADVAAAQADPGLTPAERVAEGFVAALLIAREHPLFSRLPANDVLAALNAREEETVELARGFLAEQIREGQHRGEMRDVDPQAAAEILLRIGVTFLLFPRSVIPMGDRDAARRVARTLIAPIVAG